MRKITDHSARLGVIGLGYVGLPLAVEFSRAGLEVLGIDTDPQRVRMVNDGKSYLPDIQSNELSSLVVGGRLRASTHYHHIRDLDCINICVPTPLRKTKDPDLSYIVSAVEEIGKYIDGGKLVILEITTHPGTTQEVVQPILEESGFTVGKEIFLAFSPERIDPGNQQYNTKNIPKVVGGVTPSCTELASTLYRQCIYAVFPVSSPKVAEMVKLLENTFRSVNIGLANEIALMCHKLDIDVWEVIEGAKTKPFGFMPFYPGPGLGGHCIPVDPFYLSWKAKMNGFEPRFIELAGQINSRMPHFVAERVIDALNDAATSLRNSKIHIVGVAYKRDVNDIRESPALDVMKILKEKGAAISYTDPYVPELSWEGLSLRSIDIEGDYLKEVDCCVIITDHSCFNYPHLARKARLIVDTRNTLNGINGKHIVRI